MAYRIDPEVDLQVVAEFRAQPIGPHSPNLQRVLNTLRLSKPRLALLCTRPFAEYVLVEIEADRRRPLVVHWNTRFASREEGEWFVFKRRWLALTGQALDD